MELCAFKAIKDATFVLDMSSRSYMSQVALIGKLHLSLRNGRASVIRLATRAPRRKEEGGCDRCFSRYNFPRDKDVLNTLCIEDVVWTRFFCCTCAVAKLVLQMSSESECLDDRLVDERVCVTQIFHPWPSSTKIIFFFCW